MAFNLKNVTDEEWSDYVSQFRTYQTEYIYGEHSVMYSKQKEGVHVGEVIAEVHYCANGNKFITLQALKIKSLKLEEIMDQIIPDVTPHTYVVTEISMFEWAMALAQYLKEKYHAQI